MRSVRSFILNRPDEINATEISSRLNRLRIPKSSHLTGQVGQAPVKFAPLVFCEELNGAGKDAHRIRKYSAQRRQWYSINNQLSVIWW